MNDSDSDLLDLDRLRHRDREAFASLVDRYQCLVLALGQSMGFGGADLDDAATEVFANVFLALPRFEGRSRMRTWLYRIAIRTLVKLRRRRTPWQTTPIRDQTRDPNQPAPDERMLNLESRQRLWSAVAALDPRSAAAVELHYRQGWPLAEIAETLECPVGTLKTLLFRAREQLRVTLGSQERSR